MTATIDHRLGRLPDPDHPPEAAFYDGVLPKRFLAWIIDGVIVTAITLLLTPLTGFIAVFFWPAFWLLVWFLYGIFTLAGGSATWGMRMTGMELRKSDGSRLDFGTAVLHVLLYALFVAIAPLQVVSVIMMLVSSQNQGLHDMILGVGAIRRSL